MCPIFKGADLSLHTSMAVGCALYQFSQELGTVSSCPEFSEWLCQEADGSWYPGGPQVWEPWAHLQLEYRIGSGFVAQSP